ncbi:MAG: hypothetical protein HFI65_04485 [Lachnospiraceae bacterium]|nr:hypothetical protein [Lachnospiraceae bacterium]
MKIREIFHRKTKEAKEAETVEICHERFGQCVLEKDDWGAFMLILPSLPFGKHEDVEIELDVTEEKIAAAVRCLAEIYDGQESYLTKFYEGILSFCEEWEETDSEGNAVTMELVEKNGSLFRVLVQEGGEGNMVISFSGMMFDDEGEELLGCHSVIMEIDCATGEIGYDLEG